MRPGPCFVDDDHTVSDYAQLSDFSSPNERFGYPFGLIIYYAWCFLSIIILVNVLIALFGSAYSDVVENANDEYLAFFAHKTIELSESSSWFLKRSGLDV